ncbi:MAG: hypothetical protein ACJA2S_002933 [Cyclobacteriaceae bacterium]|jgi:hypothetical protein
MTDVKEKICSSCATTFKCGGDCWCNDFPSILSVNSQEGCWCRTCLTNQMKKTIAEHMRNLSSDKIQRIQALGKPRTFTAGIDYNLNEQGSLVFSGWYLLRQGGCCGNGCLNCPYPPNIKK